MKLSDSDQENITNTKILFLNFFTKTLHFYTLNRKNLCFSKFYQEIVKLVLRCNVNLNIYQ